MTDEDAGPPPDRADAASRVRVARVSGDPLSVDRLMAAVSDRTVGGIGLFVGVVRDHDGGEQVDALDYSEHPTAETRLRAVAERVAAEFDVVAVAVEHRVGHLVIGDLAVVVAVGAVHRHDALEACHRLIDDLKLEVPIWKEQHYRTGTSSWVGL